MFDGWFLASIFGSPLNFSRHERILEIKKELKEANKLLDNYFKKEMKRKRRRNLKASPVKRDLHIGQAFWMERFRQMHHSNFIYKLMTTDTQMKKFLKTMNEGFKRMEEKMEQGFTQVDERFKTVDERLGKVEIILGNVTFMLANHDNLLKKIPTREEFDLFKSENATAHDRTVKAIEGFDQELASSSEAHDRLEERVDVHQEVLVKHKFLEPVPA